MSRRTISAADAEFLFALFERHMGIMYKTALDLNIRDEAQKDDAVHEALLRLSGCVDTLRGMSGRAQAAYMASAVRSVVFNGAKRAGVERRLFSDAALGEADALPSGENLEDAFIERETRREELAAMWAALEALDDTDRALLTAKYIDGCSDAELAERMGVLPSSIPKKLTRAKRRARRLILGKGDGRGES